MKTKIWGCILGAVMFASALQSCQTQVEIPDGAVYPILFGSTETRAVADLDDLKTNGFKVYAYFQGNVGGSASFANNVKHAVVEGLDVWSFETPEYWIPNTNYWFKAVYPGNAAVVDNNNNDQTLTIADYDIQSQTDVMVATATASVAENATAPTSGSVVNLQFKHLLANVVVKIKAEVNVTINDMAIKYVPVKCNYTNGSWSETSQGNIEKEGVNAKLSPGANPAEIDFLVIPQTVNGGQKLYIKTSDKTYDIAIPATTWNAGTKYTYTLTIKQNDILFDEPSVEEWDEESAVGSVVIK